jgi:hypothetical protein
MVDTTILENIIKKVKHTEDDAADHKTNLENLERIYKEHTGKFIEKYSLINKIKRLENDIKIKKRKLRGVISTHGAAQEKWKQVIYDNQKIEDEYKFYLIVSTLHFFILILLVMGFFDFISKFLITLGIFILYLIIVGVFVVKMDFNIDRNDFNYNEFDIKFDPSGTCNVKPQNVAETQEKNNEAELAKTLGDN